jgi:DNA (cytosine-5)-methyltransferase 1
MKQLTVIDLFSGCGGLSHGLSKAGFKILLGVDNWKDSLDTFLYNHPGSKVLVEDTSILSKKHIEETIGKQKIDLIVGGPPCQGFSLSGPRKFYDKRNRLYLDFLRIVKEVKPKAFLIENVPGLANLFGGQVKERIIEEFSKLGYKVNAKILNTSDYGVPQNRRRIVFVGLKSGKMFEFPEPTHSDGKRNGTLPLFRNLRKKITVEEAIGDLPILAGEFGSELAKYHTKPSSDFQTLMRSGSKHLYNHVASNHNPRTVEIIGMVPEGGNYKMLPEHLRSTRNFHVAWTRLHRNKPSPTIDTGHRHHFHPVANRVPTVRESARIQSFPDTFIFKGSKTSQYKQVGNAVPPLLAEALGKKLREYL